MMLSKNNPVEEQLKDKGAVGEYLLEIKRGWCEDVLHNAGLSGEATYCSHPRSTG